MVKEYINKIAAKEFIRFSNLSYSAPILIVKKFKGGLKVYIDYRTLNTFTIKNRNVFSLIRKTLSRLYKVKYYSKFDIIAAFNKIRVKKEDKEKTAFLIKYDLFKYLVMPFRLCNAPGTF